MIPRTYIMQGRDFKAVRWMEPFGGEVRYFVSAQELLRLVLSGGKKTVIFRYQNSSERFLADLAYSAIIGFITAFRGLLRVELYWIMHNIDKETIDLRPNLTRFRRAALRRAANHTFVTDQLFKNRFFGDDTSVDFITFGPKRDARTSPETIRLISERSQAYDIVALCVSAAGPKYAHADRLELLTSLAADNGKSLLIVVSDNMSTTLDNVVRIRETNIDERALRPMIDFVYRINDDISMPYTLYAACDAGIPVVTGRNFFTYEIVAEYGLGFAEEEFFQAAPEQLEAVKKNMSEFIASRSWHSLYDAVQRVSSDKTNRDPAEPLS